MVGPSITHLLCWLLQLSIIIFPLPRIVIICLQVLKRVFLPVSVWCIRCNPFNTHCVISPLLCVPKCDSSDLRFVHDLSFPKGTFINNRISNDHRVGEFYKLHLPGIDHLVHFVNVKGYGCHVFKKDLKWAFWHIPIDPVDYILIGMYINGTLCFHCATVWSLLCHFDLSANH